MATILVVDDDPTVREVVVAYLQQAGHETLEAPDGPNAVIAAQSDPDLVVLDVMLPGFDGLEVCRRIRAERPDLPIIMLTALGEEEDRIAGLGTGADDYLSKPFSPRELVLRVASVLRRSNPPAPAALQVREDGDLRVDPVARTATIDGAPLSLTTREFDLLAHLHGASRRGLLPRGAAVGRVGMGVRRPDHRHGACAPPAGEGRGEPQPAHPAGDGVGHRLPLGPVVRSEVEVVLIAAGTATVTGLVGLGAITWMSKRSPRAAALTAPLVPVIAVAAALVVSGRAMFISPRDLTLLAWIVAAAFPLAIVFGVIAARRLDEQTRVAAAAAAELEREPGARTPTAGDGLVDQP